MYNVILFAESVRRVLAANVDLETAFRVATGASGSSAACAMVYGWRLRGPRGVVSIER